MDYPFWFRPRQDVPGILVVSDDEWKAIVDMGWPDVQCPLPGQVAAAEPEPEPDAEPARPGRPRKGDK